MIEHSKDNFEYKACVRNVDLLGVNFTKRLRALEYSISSPSSDVRCTSRPFVPHIYMGEGKRTGGYFQTQGILSKHSSRRISNIATEE